MDSSQILGFLVPLKRYKIYKNPDENPNLPMDFKNIEEKNPQTKIHVKCF